MIAFLLRLYPAGWRLRYGDEFAALLEERPLGPFDVADVLLGALDAHLHLRRLRADARQRKGFLMSLRLGGAAAILGGVLWLLGFTLAAWIGGDDPAPAGAMLLTGAIALLIALVGLSAFQAREHPALVWAAFIVPAIGIAVTIFGIVAMATIGERPIVMGLTPWWIWSLGMMGACAGSILFAVATWRTRALSRPAAVLLGVGASLIVVIMGGGAVGFLPPEVQILAIPGMFAFIGGWIGLGVQALRLDGLAVRPAI